LTAGEKRVGGNNMLYFAGIFEKRKCNQKVNYVNQIEINGSPEANA